MSKKVTIWVWVVSVLLWAGTDGAAAPLGTVFTYQGRLTDAGNPANGTYDFVFDLYDAQSGGIKVGGPFPQNGISVADGYFTVSLDCETIFQGQALWLAIQVRQTGSGSFTPLSPRQAIRPTPYALYAMNAPGSGLWAASGNDIYNTNDDYVGIGTDTPWDQLHVEGSLRVQQMNGETGATILREGPSYQAYSTGLFVEHAGHAGQADKVCQGIISKVTDENSAAQTFLGNANSANDDAYGLNLSVWSGGNLSRGIQVTNYNTKPTGSTIGYAHGIWCKSESYHGMATGATISARVGEDSTEEVRGIESSATHTGTEGDAIGLFTSNVASKSGDAYGLLSDAAKWADHTDGTTYGGHFTGRNWRPGGESYGLKAQGTSNGNGGTCYGIYAEAYGGSTNWAGYFAGDVCINGAKLQLGAHPFSIQGADVIVKGFDGFDALYDEAVLYLGDTNHSIRSVYGDGLRLGTHNAQDAVAIQETTGNVGIGTISPERQLHIVGANPRVLIEASSSNPEINFKNAGDTGSEIWALYKDGGTDNLHYYQGGNRVTFQSGTGRVGIGTTSPSYKLDVEGDIECTNLHETSDVRLKKNIRPLTQVLDKVEKLRGVSFQWKRLDMSKNAKVNRKQIGVIAQEVEAVFPELVAENDEGFKSVEYTKLTAVLIEAVKELKAENEKLQQRIEMLENQNTGLNPK
jgi:endosialidase-like protein